MTCTLTIKKLDGEEREHVFSSASYAYGFIDGLAEYDVIGSEEHQRLVDEIESIQAEIDDKKNP